MTRIVLNIEDSRLVPSLKQILGAIKGVTIDYVETIPKSDPSLFSEEDFFANIDDAKREIDEGLGHSFDNVDELDKYIRSL